MRYGENSHQQAAFYIEENVKEASVATATQVQVTVKVGAANVASGIDVGCGVCCTVPILGCTNLVSLHEL